MGKIEFYEWKSLMKSENSDDRISAIEELPNAEDHEILPVLLEALIDTEELVRIGAYESIGLYPNEEARIALRKCIENETNELPLGYAIEALGRIGEIDDLIHIIDSFKTSESSRIKIYALSGMFHSILNLWAEQLTECLEEHDHFIRSSSINITEKIILNFQDQMSLIKDMIETQLTKEIHKGDIDNINNLLELINKLNR